MERALLKFALKVKKMKAIPFLLALFVSCFYHAQQAELITQEKNLGLITCIKYSADGRYIASGSEKDNAVKVWDVQSGKLIGTLRGHKSHINDVAFHPSGNYLASASHKQKTYIWDLNTWEKKDSVKFYFEVVKLEFTDKGDYLVAGSQNREVVCWNTSDYHKLIKIGKMSAEINDLDIQGEQVAVCSKLTDVLVWDVPSQKQIKKFKPHKKEVVGVGFIEGKLVTADYRGVVKVFNTNDYEEIISFQAHDKEITAIDANLRSNSIATSSLDKSIKMWNLTTGELVAEMTNSIEGSEEEAEEVRSLEYSPDGSTFSTSGYRLSIFNQVKSKDNVIKIWDVNRHQLFRTLKGEVNPIKTFAFHPTQNFLYTLQGEELSVWDLNQAERFGEVALHERGKERVQKTEEEKKDQSEKRTLKGLEHLKELSEGKINVDRDAFKEKMKERSIQMSEKLAKGVAGRKDFLFFSPEGGHLITDFTRDELRLYQITDHLPEYVGVVEADQHGGVNDLAMDPQEKYIALAGSGKESITISDINTGKVIRKLSTEKIAGGTFFEARAITFNADGSRLAAVFNTGIIIVWETSSWQNLVQIDLKGALAREAFINYSKDGKHLFARTLLGIIKVDAELMVPLDGKQPKVKGVPFMQHTPSDYIVSKDRKKIHFLNIITQHQAETEVFNTKLITGVETNKFGYVGVSLESGELKVYDPETGEERFIMVSEKDNAIFKTPENYYKVTKEGTDLVTFRVGKDAYPFEQFDAKYNRPDIVLAAMNSEDEGLLSLYEKAYKKRLRKLGLKESDLTSEMHLPTLTVLNRNELPLITTERTVSIKVSASDAKYDLSKIHVWVNDVPVLGAKGMEITGNKIEKDLEIEVSSGVNKIQVSCVNSKGIESLKQTLEVNCDVKAKRDLYIVSVGTSKYQNKKYNLNYAAKDAHDLAELLKGSKNGIYVNVHEKVLTNEEVRKNNFKALKDFLNGASVDDQVVVFIAGHGVLDAQYDYYYGTHDIDFEKPETKGLEYSEIEAILDGIKPLRKLLIMDTCHSGEVEEDEVEAAETAEVIEGDVMFRNVGPGIANKNADGVSPSKMMKELFSDLRRGTGTTVISSAGGAEFAMESDEWKNGLFTYCLLSGLRNETADLNEDGKIMLSELQLYVTEKVAKLSHGKQVPTSRIQNIALDYQIW